MRTIRTLVTQGVLLASVLCASAQTYHLPADAVSVLKQIWADRKNNLAAEIHNSLNAGQTIALYNTQGYCNNLLEYAILTGDRDVLDGVAEVCLAAAGHLVTATNYIFYYAPPDYNRETLLPLVPPARMWLPAGNIENILESSQFLYLTARTVNGIAAVPAGQRTATMNSMAATYVPVIMDDHYARWIFSTQGIFQVTGWGGLRGLWNHRDFLIQKRDRQLRGVSGPAYCNAVTDWDMWIVAGAVQMLAAHARDPALVPITAERKQALLDHVGVALQTLEDRLAPSALTDFRGDPAVGLNFDLGLWAEHPDYSYSGYTNAANPSGIPPTPDPNITWDISHATRFVPVFNTFYENRAITGRAFPSDQQMKRLAAQVAYATFNRDANRPLFSNFMNANGWYRVDSANGAGAAPYSLSGALTYGGYGFWSRFLDDMGVVMNHLNRMISDSGSPNVARSFSGAVPTGGWQGTNGVAGSALRFDGVDGYALFRVPLEVRATGTIAFWIRPETNSDGDVINIFKDGYYNFLLIRREASGALIVLIEKDDSEVVYLRSSTLLPVSQWSHVAVTQDGGGVRMYVNGADAGGTVYKNSASWMAHLSPCSAWLGKGHWSRLQGSIDDLRLYDRALTAPEITNCCISGTSSIPAPAARWPFDVLPDPTLADFLAQHYWTRLGFGENDSLNLLTFLPNLGSWSAAPQPVVLWTENWEDGGTGFVPVSTAFPGVWNGDSGGVRLLNEQYAVRPAGMAAGTTRAANGPTSGSYTASRSLGGARSNGTLQIDGWLDSRSSDGNTDNYAGIGFAGSPIAGIATPDIWVRYRWSSDDIALFTNAAAATSGNADGTSAVSPNYTNTDPLLYNQWNHVLLEVDLDAHIARIYKDSNVATADGPWVQLGGDVSIGSALSLSHAVTINSRDANTDNLTVTFIPGTNAVSYPPGDVNGDMHVTGADSLLVNQVLVGLRSNTHPIFATTGFANGDVDQTSTVTGGDPLLINQVQVGLRSYVVTKIVPNRRTNNVPTAVTIYGVGFPTSTVSGVTIGSPVSVTLSNVTVFSREQINAIVPAGGGTGTGTVSVTATPTTGVTSFGRFVNQ